MRRFFERRPTNVAEQIIGNLGEDATILNVRLAVAKTHNDYLPVWRALINTHFFVPVLVHDVEAASTKDIKFKLGQPHSAEAEASIVVAENPNHLAIREPHNVIRMRGAELINAINPSVELILGLPNEELFGVPLGQMEWLRDSIRLAG